MADVVKKIEEFDGLQALRLEGNTIGVEAAKAIAKALETKSELQVPGWTLVCVLNWMSSSKVHFGINKSRTMATKNSR